MFCFTWFVLHGLFYVHIKKNNADRSRMHAQYATYTSDESDSDSDRSESDYDSGEDARIRREQDPRYQILRTPTATSQIIHDMYTPVHVPGAPWDSSTNISSFENYTYIVPPRTTKTSLFSMKSINRDKRIYPTPYNFQLKLPRVYKNVTKFQLVQLSFPNTSGGVTGQPLFLSSLVQDMLRNGIAPECIDTCISIVNCTPTTNTVAVMEMNRIAASGVPLLTTVSIPDGNYSNSELASELSFQGTNTPPLNLITYSQFKDTFIHTRDISVLFNEPGDTFYSQTGVRIHRPTKDAIMNTYYTQQHIDSLGEITDKIAFTAYYYPIMKELLARPLSEPFLPNYSDLAAHFNGFFEGLDSEYYYQACSTNQRVLDAFRPHLTFKLQNINNYSWKFNDKENRFITMHDRLHTSIQRDISKQYQTVLNRELALTSLNPGAFATLKSNAIQYAAIYKHLETNLSSVLGLYTLTDQFQYNGGSVYSTTQSTFDVADLAGDEQFSAMFQIRSSIGGIYGNYGGTVMSFRNFMDYHSTLSTYYTIVQSTNSTVTGINQSIAMNHHAYVSAKYSGVLPQEMIDTRAYSSNQPVPVSFVTSANAYVPGVLPMHLMTATTDTANTDTATTDTTFITVLDSGSSNNGTVDLHDSIVIPNVITDTTESTFTTLTDSNGFTDLQSLSDLAPQYSLTPAQCETACCTYINKLLTTWYAGIPVNTVIGTLTYRLGILNVSANQYNIVSTIQNVTSTGNLNFLMQINDEQGFSNMDIAMNEDYAIGNDTTGQIKLVAAKILMGNVGDSGISQTLIQNPSIFENTLGKLDRLNIKIYYDDANITPVWQFLPFPFDVNEWNATFQIDEEVGFINQDDNWSLTPSIPVPKNPNDTPYIYFMKDEKK